MKQTTFRAYKEEFRRAIRNVMRQDDNSDIDEAAFPAYAHANPVIGWLFWQRIRIVMRHLLKGAPHEAVLDFGTGSGVFLPFLSTVSQRAVAYDINLAPIRLIQQYGLIPESVEVIDGSVTSLDQLAGSRFDRVLALDVLEHVNDLEETCTVLLNLLNHHGELIVSVPTENTLYRFGRKLAGDRFTGAYHERGADDVLAVLSRVGRVRMTYNLYGPMPLFKIVTVGPVRGA